jgi:hypothetical protein
MRLLLICEIDDDEYLTLQNHLKFLNDSPVRFTSPDVFRTVGVHVVVVDVLRRFLSNANEADTASASQRTELVELCCRFLQSFCRGSGAANRLNQCEMFKYVPFFLDLLEHHAQSAFGAFSRTDTGK